MESWLDTCEVLGIELAQVNVFAVTALPGMPVTLADIRKSVRVLPRA